MKSMNLEWKKFFKDYSIVALLLTIFGAFVFMIFSSREGISPNWNIFLMVMPIAYFLEFSFAMGIALLTGGKD